MDKETNILEGTKVLAITDKDGIKQHFVTEAEKEEISSKLTYYIWLSRLFIFFTIVSLIFFTSSSLVLFRLAPRVYVEPFLIINQDSSEQMVRYEPIAQNMASKNKLMELFVKQYILQRHTIINDPIEMRTRWAPGGMLNFLSSYDVFAAFPNSDEVKLEKLLQRGMVREVEIISIGKLGGERSPVWKVDFKTYDLSDDKRSSTNRGLILSSSYWTASVTAYFIPYRSFVSLRLINPLGFTVTRYSETEVNVY